MEAGVARDKGPSPMKPSKFNVYQNPALSAVLTANSLQPSNQTFMCIFSFFSASACAFLTVTFRENVLIDSMRLKNLSPASAYWLAKLLQVLVGILFAGTLFALLKAIVMHKKRNKAGLPVIPTSKDGKNQELLSKHQLELLGIKAKIEQVPSQPSKNPPKPKAHSSPSSEMLVPLHQHVPSFSRSGHSDAEKSSPSGGSRLRPLSAPTKSPGSSSSPYLVPSTASPMFSNHNSTGKNPVLSTPWSNKRTSYINKITSEEELEQFLAEVDEKITESAGKLSTPPPTISGFGVVSPNTVTSSTNLSGTARVTPLRPIRMSPSSQKFKTPPKKGEGELPAPMSMEESIEAFEHLGIYPQIEQWRDKLRQWFSSVLLNPLLNKIETSHIQVMQEAAKLGISLAISQVGSTVPSTEASAAVSSIDKTNDWQPAFTMNEDGLLHQIRATLVQAIDASTAKLPVANMHPSLQQNPLIPAMQKCVDAITEHQRLQALMKGEWAKGLLPQSGFQAEYTVQRIRELSEGTCVKNYEYLGGGEVYDKKNKKWSLELPSDTHLLLYFFCAFLEHPKWMLHVDATSYAGVQSSRNPMFLGVLPPKDRFPEKYIAIVSAVPSSFHPGACVLVINRHSPPTIALYWDKKLQFSLQGRTALWDSILLLCHRIKIGYGAVVRGLHLGSSALNILQVLETESED